jgi:hypothetical protein
MTQRKLLPLLALAATFTAAPSQASLDHDGNLLAFASASASPGIKDSDTQSIGFDGAPTPLSLSAAARAIGPHSSASLALGNKVDWSSSTDFTVQSNYIASLFSDGSAGATASYDTLTPEIFVYFYKPTVDTLVSFDVSEDVLGGGSITQKKSNIVEFYGGSLTEDYDFRDILGHYSQVLTAGLQYEITVGRVLSDHTTVLEPVDYTQIGTTRFDFAFSAAPTTPTDPGPGSVVPEPATWALMLAGFAATGALLRRRSIERLRHSHTLTARPIGGH